MPTYSIIGLSKGKPKAFTVACSEKRYKEYLMQNEEYEYSISATFLKKYLEDKGLKVELSDISKEVIATGSKFVSIWYGARVIDLRDVRDALVKLNLSYHDFIDAYSSHLKELTF